MRSAVTIATAGNFDTEVLQSQSALCVVFHVNSRACKAHIAELEQLADHTNEGSNYHWLKVVSVDSDRNSNLASAFSVQRRKVPMTFFVCNGTMIDKVSGKDLPTERLGLIVTRFKDYYQKSRGVELEAHGPFQAAKTEALTEGATTDSMESKLLEMVLGSARVDPEKPDGRKTLAEEARPLLVRAKKQAAGELDELRLSVGVDVKRLDEAKLNKVFYSTSQFLAAAHLAGLEMLVTAREAAGLHHQALEGDAAEEDVLKAIARVDAAYATLKKSHAQAAAHGSVRRVVAAAELAVSRVEATLVKARFAAAATAEKAAAKTAAPAAGPSPLITVYDAARHVIIACDAIDIRNPPAAMPLDRVEPLLGDVRALMSAARVTRTQEKAAAGADAPPAAVTTQDVQRALKLTKKALFASLASYGDDPVADKLRARAASLLY